MLWCAPASALVLMLVIVAGAHGETEESPAPQQGVVTMPTVSPVPAVNLQEQTEARLVRELQRKKRKLARISELSALRYHAHSGISASYGQSTWRNIRP
jgi:hypothetical protein